MHIIGTWNMRRINQAKLKIVQQEMKYLNIAILGVNELKWTRLEHSQSENCKMFYSGSNKYRRRGAVLIVR